MLSCSSKTAKEVFVSRLLYNFLLFIFLLAICTIFLNMLFVVALSAFFVQKFCSLILLLCPFIHIKLAFGLHAPVLFT